VPSFRASLVSRSGREMSTSAGVASLTNSMVPP
jgi:hypothetical protein